MAHARKPIRVHRADAPLKRVRVKKRSGSTLSAYPIPSSSSITFSCWANEDASDGAALWTLTKAAADITIVDTGEDAADEASILDIQFKAADLATIGRYFYKLVVTKSSKPETVRSGPFIIDA